ncbi:unnamed protein product, partial [Prorocentrum cordatum]
GLRRGQQRGEADRRAALACRDRRLQASLLGALRFPVARAGGGGLLPRAAAGRLDRRPRLPSALLSGAAAGLAAAPADRQGWAGGLRGGAFGRPRARQQGRPGPWPEGRGGTTRRRPKFTRGLAAGADCTRACARLSPPRGGSCAPPFATRCWRGERE